MAIAVEITLSRIQQTAIALYQLGLNVFPIPTPQEVKAYGKDPLAKPPYFNDLLYYSRLHFCSLECEQKEKRLGHSCLRDEEKFENLFMKTNLAVMTGRTSGNLVIIDCDSHDSFERVISEFDHRELPFLAYSTHRGGGLLTRLIDGEAANLPRSLVPDVQIWGNKHYAVLPPSIHPMGTFYQWITSDPLQNPSAIQSIPIEMVQWLGVTLLRGKRNNWEEPELYGLSPWTINLSWNNRKILATTFGEGYRNSNLVKPTYDIAALINNGTITYLEGEKVLLESARRSDYPDREIKSMLKSAMKNDPVPAREGGQYINKPWQNAKTFLTDYDWRRNYRRLAITARATFDACIERSRMDDSEVFRASERELSEIANFGNHKRARRGLRLLKEKELILLSGKGNSGAYLYRFGDKVTKVVLRSNDPSIPTIAVDSGVLTAQMDNSEKDVFIRLGKVAHNVWRHLLNTPEPSLRAIARNTQMAESSVRDSIKRRLIPNGLVIKNPEESLYYGISKTKGELEILSSSFGTLGRNDKRKSDHRIEREKQVNRKLARVRFQWAHQCLVRIRKEQECVISE